MLAKSELFLKAGTGNQKSLRTQLSSVPTHSAQAPVQESADSGFCLGTKLHFTGTGDGKTQSWSSALCNRGTARPTCIASEAKLHLLPFPEHPRIEAAGAPRRSLQQLGASPGHCLVWAKGKRFGGDKREEDSPWLELGREAEPIVGGQLGVEV